MMSDAEWLRAEIDKYPGRGDVIFDKQQARAIADRLERLECEAWVMQEALKEIARPGRDAIRAREIARFALAKLEET